MRQLLVFALRRLKDVEIVEAQDGMDGLRKVSSDHFDIALIDINMPVMDGLKLIRLMRGEDSLKSIPIVVITTEGASEDRERALKLGADEYLTKPIQANAVLSRGEGGCSRSSEADGESARATSGPRRHAGICSAACRAARIPLPPRTVAGLLAVCVGLRGRDRLRLHVGRLRRRSAGLGRVVVKTPENESTRGGLELVVADALRREVIRRAGAELVEDPDRGRLGRATGGCCRCGSWRRRSLPWCWRSSTS